ncbi:MAG TPA: hypothetical protein VME40_11010 [Caulobacteraceae bacterium]|nr:hypothetical protein [Caulobacteraceae bacterium]
MAQATAVLLSPALTVALAAAALTWLTGGLWPAAARPRSAAAFAQSLVVGVATFVVAQALAGPGSGGA